MDKLGRICSGILLCILLLSVSASADTIEVSGKNILKPVEVGMTVSFVVTPDYTIRIPAEKISTDNASDHLKMKRHQISVSDEAEGMIVIYPDTALPDTIVFLQTDFPEGEKCLILANGEPAEETENDPNVCWFCMPDEDVLLDLQILF